MITEEIIQHYKDKFRAIEYFRRDHKLRKIGVELKFPVTDQEGNAVKHGTIKKLWRYFIKRGWERETDSYTGETIGVKGRDADITDRISSETGYCKVEFSLGERDDLFAIYNRIWALKETIASFHYKHKALFLGYGIQPRTYPSKQLYMKKSRNLFWDKLFPSCNIIARREGTDVALFTITASNQAHVDIHPEEIVDTINVFNGLAAVQIALNANSPIWKDQIDPNYKSVGEIFWDWWLPGERTGMPDKKFVDLEDYLETVMAFSPVFVMRGSMPYALPSFSSFEEYYSSKNGCFGESPGGKKVKIFPQPEDIDLHNTFFWYDARLSRYLTLENRVNDQQPPEDIMVVAALTLGLVENLDKAKALIDRYSWKQLKEARIGAIKEAMQAKVAGEPITNLCEKVLRVAEEGLAKRRLGEEAFLKSLWQRLDRKKAPADDAIAYFNKGGVRSLIDRFALMGQ